MNKKLVWWSYAVELIASTSITIFFATCFSSEEIVNFIRTTAIDVATLFCAVMLAAALGFLWSFYTKSDTPFYQWLDACGAFQVYLHATLYAIGVSFTATISLILSKYLESLIIGIASCWLLILTIINFYSLISNVSGLMRLNAKYISSGTK